MLSVFDVAKYFLSLTNEDEGDLISNMKLQKLLYYAQGFSLAIFGKPLFDERIEAWTYGPVVPEVYHHYKQYGGGSISPPDFVDFSTFDNKTQELLDEVWDTYGQFSAWKLKIFSHNEPPWKGTPAGGTISHAIMKEYFDTQVIDA